MGIVNFVVWQTSNMHKLLLITTILKVFVDSSKIGDKEANGFLDTNTKSSRRFRRDVDPGPPPPQNLEEKCLSGSICNQEEFSEVAEYEYGCKCFRSKSRKTQFTRVFQNAYKKCHHDNPDCKKQSNCKCDTDIKNWLDGVHVQGYQNRKIPRDWNPRGEQCKNLFD